MHFRDQNALTLGELGPVRLEGRRGNKRNVGLKMIPAEASAGWHYVGAR